MPSPSTFDHAKRISASAIARVESELELTDLELRIAARVGVTRDQLIEQKGLPLFRAAGGRMVGWWNTLIGDLYEHVTIWEYDDMAAFQKATNTTFLQQALG